MTDLKQSMKLVISEADWMDDEIKRVALQKLEKMSYTFEFGSTAVDEKKSVLKNIYEGVQMTIDSYFDNALELKKTIMRDNLNRLRNSSAKDVLSSTMIAVDSFHLFTRNEIILPPAIMQFPMFVAEAPPYFNYAAIGFGIGHEITHGFDDLGAQYDETGNLNVWWDRHTLETFQKKQKCFIAQYSKQIEPLTKKNAYKMRSSRENDALAVPGLSIFSPEQLFFIAYANTWCEAVRNSSLNYIMETDVHSLGMFSTNPPFQKCDYTSKYVLKS
ncbi:peptidase family M13 [Dictyocaulus viviparus]|uniref:Peptidase family M13 n=1 Tax=Dictyocaulus viviparus TaxID=29172 RepID=A0A0D8XQJ3_DICVI|nr:peptidase family M13 [Dictyocaulus viviparus]